LERLELSVVVSSVVVMDDQEMLERMRDMQRIIASTQAALAAAMAAFVAGARDGTLAGEFATDEIAVALRCGRGRVLNQVRLAATMLTSLPATWAAWRAGEMDGYTASRIVEAAERLTDPDTLAESTPRRRSRRSRRRLRSCRPGWRAGWPGWSRSRALPGMRGRLGSGGWVCSWTWTAWAPCGR
jgi:hypothetical protein